MATSLTFLSAFRAWPAAPVPRPPQPIKPIRSTSLPATCAAAARGREAVAAPAATATAEDFKKSRRVDAKPPRRLLGFMFWVLHVVVDPNSEISKSETNSNDKNPEFETKRPSGLAHYFFGF